MAAKSRGAMGIAIIGGPLFSLIMTLYVMSALINAMAYQIAKEIGIAAVVLRGQYEAIVLTGGMAKSEILVGEIHHYIAFLGKVITVGGEFEMEALAAAGVRYLHGEEKLKEY